MELFIFKSEEKYIRFRDNSYEFTKMDKASVFPLDKKDFVIEKHNELKEKINKLSVKIIKITETDFM